MAEDKSKTQADEKAAKEDAEQVKAANTTPSAEVQVAEAAGITEGEVKALRDDAGLNQLPGQQANVLVWEQSEAGKEFAKDEKDRQKKYEQEAKDYDEATNKDGLSEAEARYFEAVDGSKG